MSPLPRFLAFGRRLLPFWLVWLVIVALPAPREVLTLHLFGSSLTPRINPPWREGLEADRRFDSFALARRTPHDLNARVWRLSQMMEGKTEGFDKFAQQNRKNYSPEKLLTEAKTISADFPRTKWLETLPMRVLHPQFSQRHIAFSQAQVLATMTRRCERLEPGNAYYPLLEADLWKRSGNEAAMWAALGRAAKGTFFDAHDLEWTLAIVRAHDAARPLLLEEKNALWEDRLPPDWSMFGSWPTFLLLKARQSQKMGDHRRATEIGVILGSIGDLMQRGKNSRAAAVLGSQWKGQVMALIYRTYPPKPRVKPRLWARDFAAYAVMHGRPDVAALSKKWQARQKQLNDLTIYSSQFGVVMPKPKKDAAWRVEWGRNAGAFVGAQLIFVGVSWLSINLILWRGVGAPSTAKDRIIPAFFVTCLCLGLALWCWQQIELIGASRWTPARMRFELALFTVAFVAFFGPPFLLAVWCAGATQWRHRTEFLKPTRIETELRLSPHQSTILKCGPTILCAFSLVATLLLWLGYLTLIACDIPSFDPLAWLPDDGRPTRWILVIPAEALMVGVGYCLFLSFLGFLLWFNKWRYYSGKESRPLTHGGLRFWKEALGIYLVFCSAIYLGVALWSWPARVQANRDLETRMVRGELPV